MYNDIIFDDLFYLQQIIKLIGIQVYENISSHFNETRYKQWPNVTKFIQSLNPNDILLDVGCGNGKYLNEEKCTFKVCTAFFCCLNLWRIK